MAWLSSVLRLPPIVQRSVPSMSSPKQRWCPSCDNQAVPGPRHRRQLAASEQHPEAVSNTQNGMATLSHPWATVGCVYLGSCGTPAVDWRRRATSATMNLAQSVPKLTGRRAKTVPQCMVMLTLRLCCTSPPHLQRTPRPSTRGARELAAARGYPGHLTWRVAALVAPVLRTGRWPGRCLRYRSQRQVEYRI